MDTKQEIEKKLKSEIPITGNLGFQIDQLNKEKCILTALLKPNMNHKGSVFGGSQFSLCAVAAYAFVLNWLSVNKYSTQDIVIASGDIRYRRPVTNDFKVEAILSEEVVTQRAGVKNQTTGVVEEKTRLIFKVQCVVFENQKKCTEFQSEFIALFSK